MAITQDDLDVNRRKLGDVPGLTRPMTYQEYLASPVEKRRYDVLGGWKIYRRYGKSQLPSPTVKHQKIQGNIYVAMRAFAVSQGYLTALSSPCDVLISDEPRMRQPDVLLISNERLKQNGPEDVAGALDPAPELVVEVLSTSDSKAEFVRKIEDYKFAGVTELWIVRPEKHSVETILLVSETLGRGHTTDVSHVESRTFPGLRVPLELIFS